MRAYAQIAPTFWTRGSGRKLRGHKEAQILALYLMTAPGSNLIGLYYLPLVTICHETGLTGEEVREAFELLGELAKYDADAELVWLREAACYQIGETLAARDKRRSAVERELATYGGHPFVAEFLDRYGAAYGLGGSQDQAPPEPLPDAADAPPKGLPAPQKPPFPDPAPAPVLDLVVADPDQPDRSTLRAREPRNLAEALELPVQDRSRVVEARADLAQWVQPERWPEVTAVAVRLVGVAAAQRLATYSRDAGVRALVGLFAAGYTQAELERAAEQVTREPWWLKDGAKRGLSSLTPEVVRRALQAPAAGKRDGLPPGWSKHPGGLGYLDERGMHRRQLPEGYGRNSKGTAVSELLAGIGNPKKASAAE